MFVIPILITLITLPFTVLSLIFTKLPKPIAVLAVLSATILIALLITANCGFWQTSTPVP